MKKRRKQKRRKKLKNKSEIISGVNPIYEVLKSGSRKVYEIWSVQKGNSGLVSSIFEMAKKKKIPVTKTSREHIFNISSIEKNQGIVAKVDPFQYSSLEDILKSGEKDSKGHFILILDSILDPQNLGSMIRTAHLVGAHGIIIPENNAASIGPAASRASAGAVEYIPIAQVTNLTRTLKALKDKNIWIVGAEKGGENLYSHEFSGSYAVVIGSEGKGIRRLVKEECDFLMTIPMNPTVKGVTSYNASVSAGIFLSEIARQRASK